MSIVKKNKTQFIELPKDILRLIGLFSGEFYIFRRFEKICFKCQLCYLFHKFIIYDTKSHFRLPLHVNLLKQNNLLEEE